MQKLTKITENDLQMTQNDYFLSKTAIFIQKWLENDWKGPFWLQPFFWKLPFTGSDVCSRWLEWFLYKVVLELSDFCRKFGPSLFLLAKPQKRKLTLSSLRQLIEFKNFVLEKNLKNLKNFIFISFYDSTFKSNFQKWFISNSVNFGWKWSFSGHLFK